MHKLFDSLAQFGTCDVCGKETDVVVAASAMGPISYAYCKNCLNAGVEPYGAMVSYISTAGHYPGDINDAYREIVKASLDYMGKTEKEFSRDVDQAIKDADEFWSSYNPDGYNELDDFKSTEFTWRVI